MTDKEAIKAIIRESAQYTSDPLRWVLFAFPWGTGDLKQPDDWQITILSAIRDGLITPYEAIRIAVSSGHGIGKSALVAWLILWSISTFEDTRGVVTANTESQLKTKTWAELAKWYRLCITRHWFTLTATAIYAKDPEHEKTWRIDQTPWSERNTEAFAGLHNAGKRVVVIFDEGSAIPDVVWEVTEGAFTDASTQVMWFAFGNPTRNTGRFKECFDKYRHRWKTYEIDSRTAKATKKDQIEEWIADYGIDSDFVKVRVRGMFPSMSVKQFISVEDVDRAFNKILRPEQYDFAPVILSLDPAWEGDDVLVIALRQGLMFRILRTIPKNDNDMHIANILAQLEDEHKADAVFIDGGYGTGIISGGRTMGRSWQLIWFASESKDLGCLNKRAEMWQAIKGWLKDGGSLPDDKELYKELISVETVPRSDGKIQLESKKDMKRRGIPSPNKADALALTFAYPVSKKSLTFANNTKNIQTEYNMFEGM